MGINEVKLISAGIDIGTTTTQLIISELTFKNRFPGARIPRLEIVNKEILYQSKIYITPIKNHSTVDSSAIKAIIKKEYDKAGFDLKKIDTGALIITGETAKKENAEKIVHEIAEYAGNFVVAVAGPELESILAGKGSGAARLSKKKRNKIINIDIGGGTSNIAVFENGNVVDCTCVNVGGRLIEIDRESGVVAYISKPAKLFIDYYGIEIYAGKKVRAADLDEFCKEMVNFVYDVVKGKEIPSKLSEVLMLSSLKKGHKYDGLMFSGGVAEYIYTENNNIKGKLRPNETINSNFLYKNTSKHDFEFGDIGMYLSKAFRESGLAKEFKLVKPTETIRATVVGAGTQTVNISGSTVFIDYSMLPLRNIPVVKVLWDDVPKFVDEIVKKINEVVGLYKLPLKSNPLALSMNCPKVLSFDNIERMAMGICKAWMNSDNRDNPLIIILEKDIGKVLGQTIYRISKGEIKFLSIDLVNVSEGDYIDIGKPISKDDVVPIIIKTLVFSSH